MLNIAIRPNQVNQAIVELTQTEKGKRPRVALFNNIGSGVLISSSSAVLEIGKDDTRELATLLESMRASDGIDPKSIGETAMRYLAHELRSYVLGASVSAADQSVLMASGARLRDSLRRQGKNDAEIRTELEAFLKSKTEEGQAAAKELPQITAEMNEMALSDHVSIAVNALRHAGDPQTPPSAESILGQTVISFGENPFLVSYEGLHAFVQTLRDTTAAPQRSIWANL